MVEIVDRLEGLHALADSWNRLAEGFGSPLLRHEWFVSCAEAFCPPHRLFVAIVRSKGEVTAVAPLVSVRRTGTERLELLGCSPLFEPSGFLYAGAGPLEELVDGLLDLKMPLLLRRVPSESREALLLQSPDHARGYLMIKETEGTLWLSCAEGWADFEAGLSSSRRAGFRRAKKRAEGAGKVRFEVVSPGGENLDDYFQELVAVETAGWKGKDGTAIARDESLMRFFHLYSHRAAALGMLRLSFLRVDGKAIAVLLAVEYAGRLWVLKVGYDEAWAACSPGTLLMHETIRYAFEQRLDGFEFLGTDEPWIRVWTDRTHRYVSARTYPFSPQGLVGLGLDLSTQAAGRAAQFLKQYADVSALKALRR
ncbi:MAG TPA: GNAT family N-acetyltransferase [Candidatus Manganitrophaceae bacterium]|nr:GNAT family N-acetyltransferase [Candidatus Manganitrophaceae bacterium]